ncbi:hypothetical protein BGW36DRAFT_423273 [Talaromyces proteolyticus]|uniref:Elongator complex protein 6 n=1 Tax=Talaromyces proteolyticus TaxID=1131652 RepID=A0AAD4L001_9EURO|nr:uncharacterized protein BGW36DRAFT_423273 [Talaromyces proteolyticus]KAH8703724.1 hypothetical protein BGW36DRAFT_423273 [Talaromyces proteolyticus]
MPSQPAVPHLLAPYLSPSAHSAQSLILITSVLAATSNWLVLRYLISILSSTDVAPNRDGDERPTKKIVLVSFLRNWDFWRTEAKRLGLDLQRSAEGGRLKFVDGLSELYGSVASKQVSPTSVRGAGVGSGVGAARPTPLRGPAAGIARAPLAPPLAQAPSTGSTTSSSGSSTQKQLYISGHGNAALEGLEKDIISLISSIKSTEGDDPLLILDQPDLLLAATPGINAADISDWVMALQQVCAPYSRKGCLKQELIIPETKHVHSTVITASADSPLVHTAYAAGEDGKATPLETQHSAFVVGLAHQARLVMQLRTLDTGAAKDISGVLRISRGGGFANDANETVEEKEVLYFVQRDGGIKVFGRGEA